MSAHRQVLPGVRLDAESAAGRVDEPRESGTVVGGVGNIEKRVRAALIHPAAIVLDGFDSRRDGQGEDQLGSAVASHGGELGKVPGSRDRPEHPITERRRIAVAFRGKVAGGERGRQPGEHVVVK